ncbi:hypothetical protein VCHA27O13_160108 [Vibrio chagasii]|nr:hypothetical protein VCHA27O13_160108 [Vibrio chagasii]CAH7124092.1 hypothetical protein VCHA40O237_20017 [Vibrio chagasii]CAH7367999.1 hypothetical protein VCHA48P437_70017 [Vibrio chagasii]CAH7381113.1 hypothetical protein VCHA55O508_20017 [Vibrio chagasii]CAH7425512.1 hypothetical protein VCHA44O286_80017 [Vibrio chagasii]
MTIHLYLFLSFLLVSNFFSGIKKLPYTMQESFEITLSEESFTNSLLGFFS